MAMPQAKVRPKLGKPSSAPDPIAKERIEKHGHKEGIEKKGEVFPALGHGPGGDIVGRVHEDFLEQKDGEDANIIRQAREEKSFQPKEAKGLPKERQGDLGIQHRRSSQGANGPQSPKHQGKATNPPA